MLPRLLRKLSETPNLDVVVADGGSTDGTIEAAERAGVKVVRCRRGRGPQLNAGAAAVRGDILFFIHADSHPPAGFETLIPKILVDDAVIAGAFRLRISASGILMRLIEAAANIRSRLCSMPYGDQGFFLRRSAFERAGRFADIPIMEDVDMVRRCRRLGRVVTAPEVMEVSARRWRKEGWLAATARNSLLAILFISGVSARRLAFFYPPN